MKILILSDLHLKATNDFDRIKDFTKEMLSRVSVKCEDNEKLVIITLGDIINKGAAGDVKLKYAEAEKYYSFLREEVSNVTFYFVPGNHELEKNSEGEELLGAFNEFTLKFNPDHFCFTKDDSIFNVKYESVNLMLVDSVLNRNHSAEGKMDIELLKDKLDNKYKNLIFMHYPPYETIKNDKGLETPDKLIETNSNYIFFGHQHGFPRKWDEFEKDTDIHAVGSLFAEGGNISYMLLDVLDGRIRYA